jgi:hypothetical protein
MIEIHLYGKLRGYAKSLQPAPHGVIMLEPRPDETIASLLAHMGIPREEINHIFFNAKLLATRNKMASFLGYQQVGSSLSDWDLNVRVDKGDRIGLFGTDMAILGM